jgi:hypothetical protein
MHHLIEEMKNSEGENFKDEEIREEESDSEREVLQQSQLPSHP